MPDDYSDLPEDERPHGQAKAKERARQVIADKTHDRPKGSRDDNRTRDDPLPEN